MNRKNTILIAVMINVGLLAVLFVAALTTQDELTQITVTKREESISHPLFNDTPLYQELPQLTVKESEKTSEIAPLSEPLFHKLPPLAAVESTSAPTTKADTSPAIPMSEVVVKKGDNLEKIAKIYQTTVDEIIKLNHLPSSFLKIGQVLKIPQERSVVKSIEKKSAEQSAEYYTIKVGENPWAIAIKHHMKLEQLLKINGLNEEKARKLKPGDRLRIR